MARRPSEGWIRVVRDALGMTAFELGSRMGVSQPRISQLERAEREGTIQLWNLERAAQALHSTLVYALVPIEPLEEVVRRQARLKAVDELAANSRTARFLLGDSAPRTGEVSGAHITVLAHHLIDRPGLWHLTGDQWHNVP
jgi:predicted DNA-binding mobile mystery protein A